MKIRKLAYETIVRILNSRLSFEKLYPDLLSGLNENEKKRFINYVNIFFRNFARVEQLLIKKIEKKIDSQDLETGALLLLASCEYFFLDKTQEYAVVNDYVEIAKKKFGLSKSRFINAILRKVTLLKKEKYLDQLTSKKAAVINHPEWVTNLWKKSFGKKGAESICLFNQTIPPVYIRVNRTKISKAALLNELYKDGVVAKELSEEMFSDFLEIVSGNVVTNSLFEEGYYYIQEPSHALAVKLLFPQKNQRILDLCCAPGGKSTYIQELTDNKAFLELNDISQKKRVLIKHNFKRLGLSYSKLTFQDALEFQSFAEYDKILIDAPCTGSGNFRRHPESRWNKEEEQIKELNKIQLKLLETVKYHIPVGGYLIYSTCSLFEEENMHIVDRFLAENKDYQLEYSSNSEFDLFRQKNGGYLVNPGVNGYEGAFCARIVRKA